jgi:carboxyl-terminal processing protease
LLLFVTLVTLSLSSCFENVEPPPSDPITYTKEDLLSNVENTGDYTANYVYNYFEHWLFPKFDKSKLYSVEKTFRTHYVEALPGAGELSKSMADCFFEYFFDEINLNDSDAVTMALVDSLIYCTGDDYAVYRTPEEFDNYDTDMSGEIIGIGVQVLFNKVDNTCFIESVNAGDGAEAAGILPGDYIVKVDGKPVSELGHEKTIAAVRGEIDTYVKITVLRDGKEINFDVKRSLIIEQTVSYSINEDKIGYVRITDFKENTAELFKEAIDSFEDAGCVGVIYDVRSNPGGYLSTVVEMLSYISTRNTKIVSFSNDYAAPMYDKDLHSYLIPSVVVCNAYTASAGELFTSTLRDFNDMGLLRASIVGEKTYGKGIMQSTFFYSDDSTLTLTVSYYNPPSGKNYHKIGITPDVICEDMDKALDDAYAEIHKLLN